MNANTTTCLTPRRRGTAWLALLLVASLLLSGLLAALRPSAGLASTPTSTTGDELVFTAGSFDVAPVRILNIPALMVASPQLPGDGKGTVVKASQRARLIENTLRLLYSPPTFCSASESLAEDVLEGVFLKGPNSQRVCGGDLWSVLNSPDALVVQRRAMPDGSVVLEAELPGRPVPLPLVTVTAADAALRGTTPERLAITWQKVLQRRLRDARRTMKSDALGLRLRVALLVELGLGVLLILSVALWVWARRRERTGLDPSVLASGRWLQRRLRQVVLSRLIFALVLVQLVAMLAVGLAAVPGNIPMALDVLLLPLKIALQAAGIWVVMLLARLLLRFSLRQWGSSPFVAPELRSRREQRRRNLLQAGERLIRLTGGLVLLILALSAIPGFTLFTPGPWLAGGALLGALALVFQSLLRDFAAGLITLFDDHYAVGDFVEIDGLSGDVEDIGVVATVLRGLDDRVLVIPNSRCDRLVNHTLLRSGAELILPLSPANPCLKLAMRLVREECAAFAAEPQWRQLLLAEPEIRGVKRVTPLAVELSVLLRTRAGQQWRAKRELLGRLVRRCERARVPLAQSVAAVADSD
ncbi:MAG: mechanosensitive ion channel family protein [Synechococcaceae cyanobacterium]